MSNKPDIKITQTYSLDPMVVAWVTQEAGLITVNDGKATSASKVVNEILLAAMSEDVRRESGRKKFIKRIRDYKEMTVAK